MVFPLPVGPVTRIIPLGLLISERNSLKIFGQDAGVEFSKSLLISIVNTGEVGAKTIKFKPYKIEGLENSND